MSRALVICATLCICVLSVYASNFGKGVWKTLAVKSCEESNHKFKFDLMMTPINENQNLLKGLFTLDEDLNESFGIRIDICKVEEDRCKQLYAISDDSMMEFLNKYASETVTATLMAAGIDPPEFPVPQGEYNMEYIITDLPSESLYGTFDVTTYVLKEDESVGCLQTRMQFENIEKGDEEE